MIILDQSVTSSYLYIFKKENADEKDYRLGGVASYACRVDQLGIVCNESRHLQVVSSSTYHAGSVPYWYRWFGKYCHVLHGNVYTRL